MNLEQQVMLLVFMFFVGTGLMIVSTYCIVKILS